MRQTPLRAQWETAELKIAMAIAAATGVAINGVIKCCNVINNARGININRIRLEK